MSFSLSQVFMLNGIGNKYNFIPWISFQFSLSHRICGNKKSKYMKTIGMIGKGLYKLKMLYFSF